MTYALSGKHNMLRCLSPSVFQGVPRPCGSCKTCLEYKQYCWQQRVAREMMDKKTWLATLTFDEDSYEEDQNLAYAEVKKWIDRLRKGPAKGLRYAVVSELGPRTGRFHWHACLHTNAVKRDLDGTWHHGNDSYRLVRSNQGAEYLIKGYLFKDSNRGRIRCSQSYGYKTDEMSGLLSRLLETFPWQSSISVRSTVTSMTYRLISPMKKKLRSGDISSEPSGSLSHLPPEAQEFPSSKEYFRWLDKTSIPDEEDTGKKGLRI